MRHPRSGSESTSGTGLVSAYIGHIGTNEPARHRYREHSSSPHHASYLIGRGCYLLVTGDDSGAEKILNHARNNMRDFSEKPGGRNFSHTDSYGAHLFHVTGMLLERNSLEAPEVFRGETHKQSIKDLERVLHNLKNCNPARRRDLSGQLAEHLMIALVTRGEGMDSLSVRALVHHDKAPEHKGSYDLLVVDNLSGATEPAPHEIQIKNGCQSFCKGNEGDPRGLVTRSGYLPHIAIVSGQCDVYYGRRATHVAQWLLDEARGEASPEIIKTLDDKTAGLLDTMIDPEPWRMGTLGVET